MSESDSSPSAQEWEVHVMGPDDLMPAKDYADAVRQANEINVWYEANTVPSRTEYHPYMWAVPVRKGQSAMTVGEPA